MSGKRATRAQPEVSVMEPCSERMLARRGQLQILATSRVVRPFKRKFYREGNNPPALGEIFLESILCIFMKTYWRTATSSLHLTDCTTPKHSVLKTIEHHSPIDRIASGRHCILQSQNNGQAHSLSKSASRLWIPVCLRP